MSNFEPKKVKTLGGDSFCPGAFFETFWSATGALWHFSKIFLKIFLSFVKGFQDIYGYGGLKLQTKKKVGGGYPLLKFIVKIPSQQLVLARGFVK